MDALTIRLPDAGATESLGAAMAQVIQPPLMIALSGDLGAGKTSLARALIQRLSPQARVKSPTYTLVESHRVPFGDIHHFDLYRLADPDELEQIDLSGFADEHSVLLVEWPERGGARTARPDLRVRIDYSGDGRVATIEAVGVRGTEVLDRLVAAAKQIRI